MAVVAAAAVAAAPAQARVVKRLDFESGSLRQWTDVQALRGRIKTVRSPVGQGHYAARFVVRPGDHPVMGGERAELVWLSGEHAGVKSRWRWKTLFPSDFHPTQNSAWNYFTQWHHSGYSCAPPVAFGVTTFTGHPRIRLDIRGGRLHVGSCSASHHRVWTLQRVRSNRWYSFDFVVKWSPYRSRGFISLRLNGRRVIRKTHVATLYKGQGVYLKQGLYRSPSNRTSVVYEDGMTRSR
ncbi:MAG TPA: polysaccharide lyase [Gaiellaceae bacterium]